MTKNTTDWYKKALNIIASYSDGCILCIHSTSLRGGYYDCPYMNENCKNKSKFEISKEKFEKEYEINL